MSDITYVVIASPQAPKGNDERWDFDDINEARRCFLDLCSTKNHTNILLRQREGQWGLTLARAEIHYLHDRSVTA